MLYTRVVAALGGVVKLFSFALLVPLAASFVWDEGVARIDLPLFGWSVPSTTLVFFLTFLFVLLLGSILSRYGVEELDELRDREGFLIVGFAWLILPLLGALPFLLTGLTRNPLDAYFEAMSGITTTGATVLAEPLEQYARSTMLWRALLQWVGGIGIIVMSVSVIGRVTQGGHRILEMEAPGGAIERLKPRVEQTAKTLFRLYLALTGIAFGTYLLLLRFGGFDLGWKQASYDALLHTFTTLSTGGFSHRTASIAFYDNYAFWWAVIVFMAIAGGSFPLYWAAVHGRSSRLWRSPELRFYAGILGGAALLIVVVLLLSGRSVADALTHGAFQAASFMTTTGYTSTDHNVFPDSARLVLFLLMFTGGMYASTAGGIKVNRIHILLKLSRRELQKLLHPRAVATVKTQGRIVSDDALRRIFVFFFAYITIFIAGAMVYMHFGMDLVSGLSASASAIGNIGPGFDTVASTFATVHVPGKIVAILQMWLGRLEIFTVLLLFVPATYRR